jgi:hypothetical protein
MIKNVCPYKVELHLDTIRPTPSKSVRFRWLAMMIAKPRFSGASIKSSIVLMSGAENEVLVTAEAFAKRSDLQLIGVLHKPFRVSDVLAVLWAS